jgi:plasmid stability protein
VVIRNLEDAVIARLKTKANLHGRSLEAELREIVNNAASLTAEEKVERFRAIQSMSPGWGGDSTDLLREDRDR